MFTPLNYVLVLANRQFVQINKLFFLQTMIDSGQLSGEKFLKLANYRMPFGKYANKLLVEIPEEYFLWFAKNRLLKHNKSNGIVN